MHYRTWRGGFTIVEVVIVLAVSGAIFISSMALFIGKQTRTQFEEAINDTNSKVQDVINEVASGFYPSNEDFSCFVNGSNKLKFDGAAKDRGENIDCIFLGKIIQFMPDSGSTNIKIYTVAAKRLNGSNAVTSIADADASIVAAIPAKGASPDLTETYALKWGMKVTKVKDNDTSDIIGAYAVGFFNSFGPLDKTTGVLTSGSEGVNAIKIGATAGSNKNKIQSELDKITATPALYKFPKKGITVCLDDENGHYARLIIGTNQNGLTTDLIIDAKNKTVWTANCS